MLAEIVVIGIVVLVVIFGFVCNVRQNRKRDRLNEEAERKLEEYFSARDAGAPADPSLKIKFYGCAGSPLWPLDCSAETEYQKELKKRESDNQHQDYLDWVASNNQA